MDPDKDALVCLPFEPPARSDDVLTISALFETEGSGGSASELHPERSLYSSSRVSSPAQATTPRPPKAAPPPLIRQRTAQACDKCRERKTKCSGHRPVCLRCTNRGLMCEYSQRETRLRGARFPSSVVHPGTNMNYSHFIPQKSKPLLPYQSMARGAPRMGGLASSLGECRSSFKYSYIPHPNHNTCHKSTMDDQRWRDSSCSYIDNGCDAVPGGGGSGNYDFSPHAPILPQLNYLPVQSEPNHSFKSQAYDNGPGSKPRAQFPDFNLNFDYNSVGLYDPTPSSQGSQDTSGSSSSSRSVTPSSSTYETSSEMSDLVMMPCLRGSRRAQQLPGTCWEYGNSSMPPPFSTDPTANYQLNYEIQLVHPAPILPIPTEALTEAGSLVDGDPFNGFGFGHHGMVMSNCLT